MELDHYQQQALTTAFHPEAGTGSWTALSYVGLGLGEAGEVQGKLKKVIRDHDGIITPEMRDSLIGELGDILWYIAVMSNELGTTLDTVADKNLQKLKSRKERGTLTGSGDNR